MLLKYIASNSNALTAALLFSLLSCSALPIEEFYPHGQGIDSSLPKGDDISSPEIFLQTPIRYYGELYSSIFVNNNGILSFLTEIPTFFNIQFPLDYPVIAPLYTHVDTRSSGHVYYRETQGADLLARASYNVRRLYPNLAAQFSAKSLFITTWVDVGYFKEGADKQNTYQVVVASDGDESFVELLYKDGGIQWIQGTGFGVGLPDARAQAGFVATDGRLHTLRGSGSDQIKNLDKWTNSEKPGLFTFRVGQIESGNVEPPQTTLGTESDTENTADGSCATSSTTCHSGAQCIDEEHGFCCVCREGSYGNGRTCLKDGIPLRVNGKVLLNINGETAPNIDLQAYIVTTDSRSYVALSRVPAGIGASLQLLVLFPSVIGWLFAKPVSDAKNGYQLSGGVFNHTLEMRWQTNSDPYLVKATQRFSGLDVFDQLKLEAEIHGNIPRLQQPSSPVTIPDHTQQFTRIGPGTLRSQSSHVITAENGQQFPVSIDQTINFHEYCRLDMMTFKLKTARNFISFEEKEKILRFASTTKVSKVSENEDPCLEGQVTCVANSSCLVEGDSFRCVCNPGFQTLYSGGGTDDYGCVDINECSEGTATCHADAICINQVGSFGCQCKPGSTGDGYSCTVTEQALSPCQRNPELCRQPHSYCADYNDLTTCSCHPGYDKVVLNEGFHCSDINECLLDRHACHVDATCENADGSFHCYCNVGFKGDGHDCQYEEQHTCEVVACGKGAECHDDPFEGAKCVCQTGYVGDGITCKLQPEHGGEGGNDCAYCSKDAFCRDGKCVCKAGYSGDGIYCTVSSRTILKTCLMNDCWCPPGYYEESSDSSYCILAEYGETQPGHGAHSYPTHQPPNNIDDLGSCNTINNCHPDAQCIYITSTQSYQCQCNAGYEGDGYDCSETDVSCFDVEVCDLHATCQYDPNSGKDVCRCDTGYQGDGTFCYRIPGEECDCHPNAECVDDPAGARSYCQCHAGYSGDGVNECTAHSQSQPNCNVLNSCAPTAVCIYSNEQSDYKCQCRPGYEGDGLVCHKVETCHDDPTLCHRHAICTQTTYSEYSCQCKPGYVGNGQKCREEYTGGDEFLLVNQGMATLRIPFQPSRGDPGYPIQLNTEQIAIGLTADCVEGRVYWSDIMSQSIKSSLYNGSDVEDFLTEDIGSPEGLVIDWINRDLYWTDSTKDNINVIDLDSKERTVIVSQGLVNPRGIAVHPRRGKVFWSDWNRASPKLEVANLDGTGRAIFVQGPAVQLPNSLAIDWQTDELCWADAGTKSIECIGITSLVRRTVATNCSYPFGLAVTADKYYWTDWTTHKIESAWKATNERAEPLTVPLGGAGKLYGISPVTRSCPPS